MRSCEAVDVLDRDFSLRSRSMGLLLFKQTDGLKMEPDRVAFARPLPIGPPTHHLPWDVLRTIQNVAFIGCQNSLLARDLL